MTNEQLLRKVKGYRNFIQHLQLIDDIAQENKSSMFCVTYGDPYSSKTYVMTDWQEVTFEIKFRFAPRYAGGGPTVREEGEFLVFDFKCRDTGASVTLRLPN